MLTVEMTNVMQRRRHIIKMYVINATICLERLTWINSAAISVENLILSVAKNDGVSSQMKSALSYRSGRCENEASRRLYRGASDIAQRLEHRLNNVSNIVELFSSEVTDLRAKLKDYCERLIFTDPVEYGKKAEDLLWRKVFYEFFQKCKQHKKRLIDSQFDHYALQSHLLAGIGFYHHMLLRIQTEFHIDLESKIDIPFMWQLNGVKKERWKKYRQSARTDENIQLWAHQACHRILVYLGDFARYIAELHDIESRHLAERYYLQAFCLDCKSGTPHNQLGSLSTSNFDSAYHYMRCLASYNKFDGAEGNLVKVFEKNDRTLKEINTSNNFSESSLKRNMFSAKFLKLCENFYISSDRNLQSFCQETLQEFDSCVLFNDNNFPDFGCMTDDVVFKVTVMAVMCVTKLKEKGSSDISAATAFTLALFSRLVQMTVKRLVFTIYELKPEKIDSEEHDTEQVNNLMQSSMSNSTEELNHKNALNDSNKENVLKKSGGKRNGLRKLTRSHLRKLRRRRKRSSTSQEDSELSDVDIMELPESDEENGLLNSDGSQPGSYSSESLSEHEEEDDEDLLIEEEDDEDLLIEEEEKSDTEKEKTSDKSEVELDYNKKYFPDKGNVNGDILKEKNISEKCVNNGVFLPSEKLLEELKKNGLLQSLKILIDWLRPQKEIISACTESSQFLIMHLVEMLNLLLQIEGHLLTEKNKFTHLRATAEDWKQKIPLPEDILLQNLPAVEDVHAHMKFSVSARRMLSPSEQVFLRIQCLLYFGNCLTQANSSVIAFNKEKRKYYIKQNVISFQNSDSALENIQDSKNDPENQRQQLMQMMAHLWLKAEVNNLETIVEGGSHPQLSPYLVTDTSVLCYHLPLVKQLITAKRFIIVVPKIVIDNLDQLKKMSLGAREAIRWLESVLQKGSRHIRAQRDVEKASLVPMKYPKRKDKDSWDFFQILECCHYLVQQQSGVKATCPLVTLVIGSQNQLPSNATALSRSLNIGMESLETFFSKWKNASKNPG